MLGNVPDLLTRPGASAAGAPQPMQPIPSSTPLCVCVCINCHMATWVFLYPGPFFSSATHTDSFTAASHSQETLLTGPFTLSLFPILLFPESAPFTQHSTLFTVTLGQCCGSAVERINHTATRCKHVSVEPRGWAEWIQGYSWGLWGPRKKTRRISDLVVWHCYDGTIKVTQAERVWNVLSLEKMGVCCHSNVMSWRRRAESRGRRSGVMVIRSRIPSCLQLLLLLRGERRRRRRSGEGTKVPYIK